MSYKIIKKMPSTDEIIAMYPISKKAEARIKKDIEETRDILSGRDSRLLFIIGPCSAWPKEAVLEYAKKLKKLSDSIEKKVKVMMRAYIQKPRTVRGWLGPVNQPDPFAPADISKGIAYCREMMVKVIEIGLPIADEALFTHNAKGFAELLSWMAIGARSVEDQEHRIFASGADCPVGMKNGTSGSIEVAVNGISAAQHKHVAVIDGYQVEMQGNPYAHLVLRGGETGPNYHPEHVHAARKMLEKHRIDGSHDNCKVDGVKSGKRQAAVILESMTYMKTDPEYRRLVRGFMIESFLKDGSQELESMTPETIDRGGLSITDPCLGWEGTEELLKEVAKQHLPR
jgi:3-deoxy-7-phosphoheptulonate synthase